MKPLIHAESSAKRFGGKAEDYIHIHQWFDQTKAHLGDNRHRAILHNSFGIFLCEALFGLNFINSECKSVSVRDVGEQHVMEDLGFIPSVSDYLAHLPSLPWMNGSKRSEKPKDVYDGSLSETILKNPTPFPDQGGQPHPMFPPMGIPTVWPDPKDDKPFPPFNITVSD